MTISRWDLEDPRRSDAGQEPEQVKMRKCPDCDGWGCMHDEDGGDTFECECCEGTGEIEF